MKLGHGTGLLFGRILLGAYRVLDQVQKAAGEADMIQERTSVAPYE
jgi:hypothetical protein